MKQYLYEQENVTAYFDSETDYVRINFRNQLSSSIMVDMYKWLYDLLKNIEPSSIHGAIISAVDVIQFEPRMLHTASKESRKFNKRFDLSHVPIALVVKTMYQEQIINLTTKLHTDEPRRKTVYSLQAAQEFIQSWRANNLDSDSR